MQALKEMIIKLELDDTEAKVKLDSIEAQVDRILDKQKQLILKVDDKGNISTLDITANKVIDSISKLLKYDNSNKSEEIKDIISKG